MSPKALRVVVADDHAFYRQGLVRLLAQAGIDVVAEAANGAAAIVAVDQTNPDVVVLDLNMPGMTGAEVVRRLQERTRAIPVLILSVSAEEADVTEAIVAGASGYVLKDGSVEEVVAGITAAAGGDALLSPRIAAMLLRRIRDRDDAKPLPPPAQLSDRELEVLKLVAQGKGNREIARELFIVPSTVRNHISTILLKLEVDNRVQAAVTAIRHRIV